MDITEVTVADYEHTVLGCDAGDCPVRPDIRDSSCSYDPELHGALPVTCVTWDEARKYCEYLGKRLCSNYGRRLPHPKTDVQNVELDEWFNACTQSVPTRLYPYGDGTAYDPEACNGRDLQVGMVVDAGSLSGCRSGLNDAFVDLSGNVSEWEDACYTDTGNIVRCSARGGSWTSDMQELECRVPSWIQPDSRRNDLGFRCCGG